MQVNKDFSVEPFRQRKRGIRSDKGKAHNYPDKRRIPCLNSSLNVRETNLSLNAKHGKIIIMKHKGTPSMREYWRQKKRIQREKAKPSGNDIAVKPCEKLA
ncbi:MAG: hypothetical protein ABSB71_09610 [Candidatus Bathyarchaeia archaeon]